jgi:hypothetical protein
MVGSSRVEVKLFGPVQEYVAVATVAEVKLSVVPTQTGPLFDTGVGAAGMGFTVADVVPAGPGQPATVTVTE